MVEEGQHEDRPPSIPPPDPLIGRTLDGRYRVEAVLGEGGMGLVYRAKHAMLNKSLAIKVLKPEVSKDTEVMQRFQQEAQSATAIGSPHIIDISDFGSLPDGSTYFVMEFLDGVSLTKALELEHPMRTERVVRVAKQICDALGAAHERSIVHRDMKPDNIYLVKRGHETDFVKVLDFGIAKVGGASSKLTKAGQVFGTPHYMSPEQCAGANVDQRTDIYALGVILYEMASGRVPFDADNLMGILTKHMYEKPIAPHELPPPVDVPPGLEAVIMKCLEKSTEARYQTMAEVKADLEALEAGLTPRAVVDAVDRASMPQRADGTGRMANPTVRSAMTVGTGEHPAPPARSMLPVVLGVGGLFVAVLAVGGYFAYASLFPPTPTAVPLPPTSVVLVPPPTTVAIADPPPSTTTTGGGSDTAPPPMATTVAAAPVHITSTPEGAEVLVNGAHYGTTPCDFPRPSGSEIVQLTVRQSGYQDRTIAVSAFGDPEVNAVLERARTGTGRRPPPSSTTSSGTATPPPTTTTTRPSGGGGDGVLDPWAH
ncbi:MAG: serine/threonine-protein kinase [Sandaracinus sp.]